MTVRTATIDDIDDVYALCREFQAMSPYCDIDVSEEHFYKFLAHYLEPKPKEHIIMVYEKDGEIGGIIAGQITVGSLFFSENRIATEMVWYVEPHLRAGMAPMRLLQAYEKWAEMMGCKKISLAALDTAQRPALTSMYEKMGYVSTEETFVRDI